MAADTRDFDPTWTDLNRAMGQLFMMGFDGTEVTAEVRELIEKHHLGSVLLTAKNLKSAEQTCRLVLEMQKIAHDAGHPVPLAVGLDQENGGVNSLFDEIYIRQFPSSMGVAATGSTEIAYKIANATAQELRSLGINWIMGPVLDVLTNARNQPLGVRTTGDDPQEVSDYGVAFMKGYREAGLATCGKHFPSYGNLEFLGSSLEVPVITDSLEQLSLSALVPFKNAIAQGIDSMMVGGCAMSSAGMNAMHACLSEQVVQHLLREDLKFDGVVISECLEMEALSQNIGVGGGTVMAVNAGCDLILLCRSFTVQQEALNGLKLGVEGGTISRSRIYQSLRRILNLKSRCTSWHAALNPGGIDSLSSLQPVHTALSTAAYNNSITVVRDRNRLLPLCNLLEAEEELLLISPLVKPLPASAASRTSAQADDSPSPGPPSSWEKTASVMSGEEVFKELGRSLARQRSGRVLHASYTANGVRPVHENLIQRAGAVIVLTADANRNMYQHGFTKHVAMICGSMSMHAGEEREKPLVVVSVSSPYDFAMDSEIGCYVCTYDFTETALQALVKVLYGELAPHGALPGTISQNQKLHQSKQVWLVETWNEERDASALDTLLNVIRQEGSTNQRSELSGCTSNTFLLRNIDVDESHYVVRNTSTHELYGFCSTYFFKSTGTGVIGVILVDPERRKLSIGHSLHNRAIENLLQSPGIKRIRLGSRIPSIYLGIATSNQPERKRLRQWFAKMGWNTALSRPVCSAVAKDLSAWSAPQSLVRSLQSTDITFDLVQGWEYAAQVLNHIQSSSRQGIREIYRIALTDARSWIIRARDSHEGVILGSAIIFHRDSSLAEFVPSLKDMYNAWGISSPIISHLAPDYATLLLGLLLLGVRYIKKQNGQTAVLDCVDSDGNCGTLTSLGFTTMHTFVEVTCDATTWTRVPPS